MTRSRRLLWLGLAIALLTGYGLAYYLLPERIARWGITHLRIFDRDFQPYLFAPAGWLEALAIRLKPPVPFENCAHVVVLKTQFTGTSEVRVELRFQARPEPPATYRTIPYGEDILVRAESHGAGIGATGFVVFADEIKAAADYLRHRFPRPYTLENVLAWYAASAEEQTQLHLLTLLGASRDPRAGIVITGEFYSGRHELRWHAHRLFHWFYLPDLCHDCYNLESEYAETREWLERNSGRLWADSYEAIYER